MNADLIISLAPIGSVVEWSDGAPRPPEHHVATLYHWNHNNGAGLLVRKCGETGPDHPGAQPFFMLRCEDDLRTFSVGLTYRFRIASRPKIGSIRIFERDDPAALMLHLADDWDAARAWLTDNTALSDAFTVEVTADELAADHVEGRTAA
ncbi:MULTISPECIES: hypothetical protein [Hyphomicrobiales]|jgi:hypothetical protein|uniref:hypothetical protein n=1 Tax=Hyphomicrobiales TaxID=356 RepID=UPI0010F5AFD8|nr:MULTISPECIES: hypothetical protein [Mesorhizobium]MBA3038703.1 hypothetical protein [Rhizobiaceae bacterium]MBA4799826.1 hypothetical protein [Hyphomicrobiales bacterium]MBN9138389.1 hypothetical protein [Phyllobacterium sp.]MBN9217033.1 hypothetical protein [Mesorhizobium sp.]